ncbi:MAG: NAD+ synthase [Candidatus Omnitrophica bacterium]|nr:NAD+ synthase [Candidatus Omnitrophota bacterium]
MPSGKPFKIHLAQINTTVGDLPGNRQKIVNAIHQARLGRADLVSFPELTIAGYPPEDLLYKKKFIKENRKVLESLRPETAGLVAVVGFVDQDKKGLLYNAAAVFADRKLLKVYRKNLLPNYGVFDEKRYFTAGSGPAIIAWKGMRIGLTICEDIWQKESYVYQKSFRGKVSLILNISASPYYMGKQSERFSLVQNLARHTGAFVAYHNLVGGQDELVFDGGSFVVSPQGRILCQAKRFEEDAVAVDLSVTEKIKNAPALMRPEEETYQALCLGTRDYVRKNGFKKVLVGLSGGIDSALVACVARDALGKENVIGVTMPSRYTSQETLQDAKVLADNLDITCHAIEMDPIFASYLKTLEPIFLGQPHNIAEENLQARVRGNILMAIANKFGHMVLTTGNKSEMATGYCTLYGDMAGGFAVIKDVPKTLVFRLARYRNAFSDSPIPVSTIARPPSAELRHNQKDQDTLPPYSELDRFIELYVEKDLSVDEVIRKGIQKDVALKSAKMVDGNEYKRRQSPPGVKITPKAFGRDRRMPITNRFLP